MNGVPHLSLICVKYILISRTASNQSQENEPVPQLLQVKKKHPFHAALNFAKNLPLLSGLTFRFQEPRSPAILWNT